MSKSLNVNKLKNKKSTIVSSEEALKNILPFNWSIDFDSIVVKPKVKNGKVLLDRNNKDHQYIIEEE